MRKSTTTTKVDALTSTNANLIELFWTERSKKTINFLIIPKLFEIDKNNNNYFSS